MFKNLTLLFAFCLFAGWSVQGQIQTPAASPAASFTQMVGLTEVSAEYSRPGVKDRVIFAETGLVPYGKIWRTGANAATKISFSEDVMIEGKDLKAGSYAVLTKPGATTWEVYFYKYDSGNFGSYVEKSPELAVTVTPRTMPFSVHNFFITVADLHNNGGVLEFIWDTVLVPVKLDVHTNKQAMASIERTLSGPSDGDYYSAGSYLFSAGGDLDKALKYVQKATHSENPRFWQLRTESEILAALGRTKEAIAVAEKSKKLAMEANNADYIKINTDNISKWKAM